MEQAMEQTCTCRYGTQGIRRCAHCKATAPPTQREVKQKLREEMLQRKRERNQPPSPAPPADQPAPQPQILNANIWQSEFGFLPAHYTSLQERVRELNYLEFEANPGSPPATPRDIEIMERAVRNLEERRNRELSEFRRGGRDSRPHLNLQSTPTQERNKIWDMWNRVMQGVQHNCVEPSDVVVAMALGINTDPDTNVPF